LQTELPKTNMSCRTFVVGTLCHKRYGTMRNFCVGCMQYVLTNVTVKESWKSVNFWLSYGEKIAWVFLWLTV